MIYLKFVILISTMNNAELVFLHSNSEDRLSGVLKLSSDNRSVIIDYVIIQIEKRFDTVEFAVI